MNTNTDQKFIVRTDRAGVFFCEIESRSGSEATLTNARRIHYWQGASECIQIAQEGVGGRSKITMSIPSLTVLGVIEILPCTDAAARNLSEWPEWKL